MCIRDSPSSNAGPEDFALSVSSAGISVPQGRSAAARILVIPRGGFSGKVNLAASGLPPGVTASFSPASKMCIRDRPTAEPKKFEVPSHQWVDLTDMSGEFGATILTDCKNGSDKPNDHTIRLTLIRTPGTAGGYADQGTQDIGHHEFVYGIAGHAAGWREAQTDWQAQRLNAPLIAFETSKHEGAQGRIFSLLKVNNPRIRILAVKKAEQGLSLIHIYHRL